MSTYIKLAVLAIASLSMASPMPDPTTKAVAGDCTTTVTHLDHGFTGDFKPTSTITLYNSTVTVPSPTDCHGCSHVTTTEARAPFWGGHGPQVEKVVYVYASTPTTISTPVCATATKAV
ncbi:hypothetical protein CkaCkLH20_09590 [Colletotrichum karsti]|uniref:Clock-controlled protein 6 n=1 Tax=Colletotrichum karsti TaxID=1095194 RepID=A0A9P6HZM8_9PEZI|nr:uncharacterized protein CkaCkLH20_09590 [Colletotrichum karsti]KAF9873080.1 hypothetical protein CkaCkLH20_09590 [Colletotrichum karsti]